MKLYLMKLAVLQPGEMVPAYLIVTDDGKNVLIDSSFPESFIDNPPVLNKRLTIEMRKENYIVNKLAALGRQPADIDMVICTHFDIDHAGRHAAFGAAEFVVQRTHYDAARDSREVRFVSGCGVNPRAPIVLLKATPSRRPASS